MARSTVYLVPLALIAPCALTGARADGPAATGISSSEARLWGENSLWKSTAVQPPKAALKLGDATNMLADQFAMLGILRDWSGTLRGGGKMPSRTFKFGEFNKESLNFVVGAQQLPTFDLASVGGSSTGMSLRMGWLTIGSTQGQRAINRALLAYDQLMTGEQSAAAKLAATDESSTTWISAQPLNSSLGKLDLMMAHGSRDLTPGSTSDKQMIDGLQFGARGEFNLPRKWKLRSEWVQSKIGNQADANQAWKMAFNGPIKHPWGVATAVANISDTDAGFATLGNPTASAEGRRSADLSIQQNVAAGDITGSLALSLAETERTDAAVVATGIETANDKAETNADLRWKLSPSLGVFAKHNYRATSQDVQVDAAAGTETKNSAVVSTGDVGLEMKVTKSLALTVSGGQTKTDTATLLPAAESPIAAKTTDDRIAIGIQRRTSGGLFAFQMARHSLNDELGNSAITKAGSMQFNAERQVMKQLRLKGSYMWADDNSLLQQLRKAQATRSAEAQFAVPSLGRFDLLYSDWAGNNSGVDPVTGASLDGAKKYGVRFNIGSADRGTGLGMSLEYALQDVRVGDNTTTLRVGLTYK